MPLELILKSNTYFDFSFGTVIKGKEMQLFGEYFPLITPVMAECDIQPIGSFVVITTNHSGLVPEQGALTCQPSPESYARFHNDPRFLEAKPLRDDAMEFLTVGNFFKSLDKVVSVETSEEYAVIIAAENPLTLNKTAMLELPLANNSPSKAFAGKSMTLQLWSDEAETLLSRSPDEVVVFKIRFNAPKT